MKLSKVRIDYKNKTQECFNGKPYLLLDESGCVIGQFHWSKNHNYWLDIAGNLADCFILEFFKDYAPLPEFERAREKPKWYKKWEEKGGV